MVVKLLFVGFKIKYAARRENDFGVPFIVFADK